MTTGMALFLSLAPAHAEPVFGASARSKEAVSLWLGSAWRDYTSRHMTPEGAVIDDANEGISHSEGQGYGMVLAVADVIEEH